MPRNIELKARLEDPAGALRIAGKLGAPLHCVERQLDIYFTVPRGRLKLRRRWGGDPGASLEHELPAELIAYFRPDEAGARASDYVLLPLEPAPLLEEMLGAILGVDARVEKKRTVFLHENVRIHIDEVVGLGSFLEFEAIVDEACDDRAAGEKLADLRRAFGIADPDVVAGSYRELVG